MVEMVFALLAVIEAKLTKELVMILWKEHQIQVSRIRMKSFVSCFLVIILKAYQLLCYHLISPHITEKL